MYINASRYLRLSRDVKSNVPALGRDCLDWLFFICTTEMVLCSLSFREMRNACLSFCWGGTRLEAQWMCPWAVFPSRCVLIYLRAKQKYVPGAALDLCCYKLKVTKGIVHNMISKIIFTRALLPLAPKWGSFTAKIPLNLWKYSLHSAIISLGGLKTLMTPESFRQDRSDLLWTQEPEKAIIQQKFLSVRTWPRKLKLFFLGFSVKFHLHPTLNANSAVVWVITWASISEEWLQMMSYYL